MRRGLTIVAGVLGLCVVMSGWITATAAEPLPVPSVPGHVHLVPRITSILTFADGTTEVKQGQGFIIGHRLFTVYHTLAPRFNNASPTKQEIYVAGTLITPIYTHSAHDIAIFAISETLCKPYCNTQTAVDLPALSPDHKVYWMQETSGKRMVKAGRVQHYAWLSEAPPAFDAAKEAPCQRNLVVEVDTPFHPGTSGSPVFDATTDAVVGMIQGSLLRAGGDTGYFKPLTCLIPLAQL